ncbi:hypothetical protein [Shouchella clausii]|uniref:hypothetical protein n=1 Tax=Shouchella clausii TaxID=79880 RepID=UPI0011552430|nr:hypothetical protein [Shouchella clausii]
MNRSPMRLTAAQLHQRLIHAQAEAAKLEIELKRYKNDYHYNMIDQLQAENKQLQERLEQALNEKHKLLEELAEAKAKSFTNPPPPKEAAPAAGPEVKVQEEEHPSPKEKLQESTFYVAHRAAPHEPTSEMSPNWFSRNLLDRGRSKKE